MSDTQSAQNHRDTESIVEDLERLCQEDGFVYTFLFSVLSTLFALPDSVIDIDWSHRPNHQELAFLLGLMVKQPLSLTYLNSVETFNRQNISAHELLKELHRSLSPAELKQDSEPEEFIDDEPASEPMSRGGWLRTDGSLVEPIFYGEEGAFNFQYTDLAAKRYRHDSEWIESYLGTSLESIIEISQYLNQLLGERFSEFEFTDTIGGMCERLKAVFLVRLDDLREIGSDAVTGFLRAFGLKPGRANQNFGAIGSYNEVHSRPAVIVEDAAFLFPIQFYLDKSIYESPFYWMMGDRVYKATALSNRGDATEEICFEMLQAVFGTCGVYRGVEVSHQGRVVTDIDLLALYGNKALIVQAKSKKLTVESRKGDSSSLTKDFHSAIQSAYDQALASRKAVIGSGFELTDKQGNEIQVEQTIDEAYILCITGDHYPMLPLQTALYLRKRDGDPYPITMSVFDLDILSCYLSDPYDMLYYTRQRTKYLHNFQSISEKALLAYHLKRKLLPDDESESIEVHQNVAQFIDADFPVARLHWPTMKKSKKLSAEWNSEAFSGLISAVKGMWQAGLTDAIFFLYDLAGDRGDSFVRGIERLKRATLRDAKIHDLSLPMPSDKRGISFLSFPEPHNDFEAQAYLRHLEEFALLRKYKSYADEWLAFAWMAGSSNIVDAALYSKETWKYDDELDGLVKEFFSGGKVVNAPGRRRQRKPGRNSPCPCGSQLKYKRCHGR